LELAFEPSLDLDPDKPILKPEHDDLLAALVKFDVEMLAIDLE